MTKVVTKTPLIIEPIGVFLVSIVNNEVIHHKLFDLKVLQGLTFVQLTSIRYGLYNGLYDLISWQNIPCNTHYKRKGCFKYNPSNIVQ